MAKPYNAFTENFASGVGPLDIGASMDEVAARYRAAIDQFFSFMVQNRDWNLIVRRYDASDFQSRSIVADLVSAVGVDASALSDLEWFARPSRANPSASRKVCDVTFAVWNHMGRPTSPEIFNQDLVSRVAGQCRSGDDRPVLETMDDAWMVRVSEQFDYFERGLVDLSGRPGRIFASTLPDIHGAPRPPLRPIDLDEVRRVTDCVLREITHGQDASPAGRRPPDPDLF